MNSGLNQLADAAALIALHGAREYLVRKNLKAEPEALKACIKSWAGIKLQEALADAKEAFECGMTQAGVATFTASMIQTGIEAAKECGMPTTTTTQPGSN